MLTDSVALAASASKPGRVSIADGAARAAQAATAESSAKSHLQEDAFIASGTRIRSAALLVVHDAVRQVELLVRHPERLDQLAARLLSLLEAAHLPLVGEEHGEDYRGGEPEREPARDCRRGVRRTHACRR